MKHLPTTRLIAATATRNPARRRFVGTLPAAGAAVLLAAGGAGTARAQARPGASAYRIVEVARGLENPWSVAFLPDGRMLVTERPGRLRLVLATGTLSAPVTGVPAVHASGQGGLLDVVLSPAFATDNTIYLSFAQPTRAGAGARTSVVRAELAGNALRNVAPVFSQKQDPGGGHHFGSRLVFARDGNLWITLGDRGDHRDKAQDLGTHFGKIVRLRPDGSVPPDNPFVNTAGALPEIWSYGHRNVQGAALHPVTGKLWAHEHGPQGGDEINVPQMGKNHGWPVITYGREYGSGAQIGEATARADIVPPVHQWTPSIAPCGLAFYTGDKFPAWRGNLFAGSLKFNMLSRVELDGEKFVREERLLTEVRERIRDVRQGPDGLLYVLTDAGNGRLLRLAPA